MTVDYRELMPMILCLKRSYHLLFWFELVSVCATAGKELEKLALEAGFADAKHYEIGGGLMGNLVATR